MHLIAAGLLLVFLSQPARGQVPPAPPAAQASRAAEIDALRRAKQGNLTPDKAGKVEEAFVKVQDIAETLTGSALRLKFSSKAPGWGGLIPGTGFAMGVEYYRPDLANGEMIFRTAGVGTFLRNYLFDMQATFPRLADGHLEFDSLSRYKAERSIDYYGPGPDSELDERTNYNRETTEGDLAVRWKSIRRLELGVTAGFLWFNVGPGIDSNILSTEQRFGPLQAPGIHQQTNFFRAGGYAFFDSRLNRSIPVSGTQVQVSFDRYEGRRFPFYSFGLLDALVQHSITFFNEKRILILRANSTTSHEGSNDIVPFYLQPTLGGPDDLRGFRQFRFTDNNRFVLNAEYRWEIAPPLDMAIFADGGKVFHDTGELNFKDLEAAGGFGVRFKTRTAVPMRVDVGFSREGVQLWLRFSDLF